MSLDRDPQKKERQVLLNIIKGLPLNRVLDIGCGDGRLTWNIASKAELVVGIDPKAERIEAAQLASPPEFQGKVQFFTNSLEEYAAELISQKNIPRFDLAIFSWSL